MIYHENLVIFFLFNYSNPDYSVFDSCVWLAVHKGVLLNWDESEKMLISEENGLLFEFLFSSMFLKLK